MAESPLGNADPHSRLGRKSGESLARTLAANQGTAALSLLPAQAGVSRPAQAYVAVREGIILGRYPQGSRLTEQRLAGELQISRIPLREAIRQLEVDGFARSEHRRGAVVTTWTSDNINHLFDVRLSLEVAAAGYAASAAAGRGAEPLERVLRMSEEQLDTGDPLQIAEASAAFHAEVVRATGNSLMASLMGAVTGRLVWLFYLTSQRDAVAACSEHHELTDAIRSGNPRVAEAVAYAHIERGRIPSLAAMSTDN